MRRFAVAALLVLLCAPLLAVDRSAFTFTDYKLEVDISPATSAFAAHGTVSLRNATDVPQKLVVLQISSSLDWKKITVAGKPVQWQTQPFVSDIDHTGSVSEAIVNLPRPVAPGATVQVEIAYEGTVALDTTRLERVGVPKQVAATTDWDQVSAGWSGVRGLGYVVWYPVSLESVSLSNGNEVFGAVAVWNERQRGARLHAQITTLGSGAPVLDDSSGAAGACPKDGGVIGGLISRVHCMDFVLGERSPAFTIGPYLTMTDPGLDLEYLSERAGTAQDYAKVAKDVQRLVSEWFGPAKTTARVIDIGPLDAASFDAGPVLFTPLKTTDSKSLEVTFAHLFAHASLDSPRPWIYEGAAHFAQVLEREQQDGRRAALDYMGQFLPALVGLEKQLTAAPPATTASPAQAPSGQPMVTATDEIVFRSKAMYAWWMLRDMIGDQALKAALKSYRFAEDQEPSYMQRLLEAQAHRSLESFFDDWVYRDRGLPDFRIASTYPRPLLAGGYTVTVTVENLGHAGAEVPVTVEAAGGRRTQRVLVPGSGKAIAHIQVPDKPLEVTVNDGSVPESDTTNNTATITVPPQ